MSNKQMNGKKTIRSSGRRYPMLDLEDVVKMMGIIDKRGGGKLKKLIGMLVEGG